LREAKPVIEESERITLGSPKTQVAASSENTSQHLMFDKARFAGLTDLEQSRAVLNTLASQHSRRSYEHAIKRLSPGIAPNLD